MKIQAKVKYAFELSAKELTHLRHALNIATANSTGKKSKEFKEIHDYLTAQIGSSLESYKQHFTTMLEMTVINASEERDEMIE